MHYYGAFLVYRIWWTCDYSGLILLFIFIPLSFGFSGNGHGLVKVADLGAFLSVRHCKSPSGAAAENLPPNHSTVVLSYCSLVL